MEKLERKELHSHRDQINSDLRKLVDKYRAIFDWDVPDIDQDLADQLILKELRKGLGDIEEELRRKEQ